MGRRKRILVVDDNLMNQEIIDEVLCDEYDIIMASNGPDALQLADRCQPRIVLLDIMLPGMDGYDVCRQLRSKPELSDLRIIMVSAKAMPSERATGIEAGADAFITKPFDEADLLTVIRSLEDRPVGRSKFGGQQPCVVNAKRKTGQPR